MRRSRRVAALLVAAIGLMFSSPVRTQTGPHATHTGHYYPVTDVHDWIDRGYHRIGGSSTKVQQGPSHPGYAGHFMSPDAQVNDFHTGQAGRYNFTPDVNVYHNGYDVMAPTAPTFTPWRMASSNHIRMVAGITGQTMLR